MCILKIHSDTHSFTGFAQTSTIPVVSVWVKGDNRGKSSKRYSYHRVSLDVSNREWDDFPGQVEDAIAFLSKWESELVQLLSSHKVTDAYLDFPIISRLNDSIVNQNDHLPRGLITIAGRIGLGIEMAIYSKDAFDIADGEA